MSWFLLELFYPNPDRDIFSLKITYLCYVPTTIYRSNAENNDITGAFHFSWSDDSPMTYTPDLEPYKLNQNLSHLCGQLSKTEWTFDLCSNSLNTFVCKLPLSAVDSHLSKGKTDDGKLFSIILFTCVENILQIS